MANSIQITETYFIRTLFTAILAIAMAFTLSCSGDDGGEGGSSCSGGTIKIGNQVWQKCNLNVVPSVGESRCYDNDPANCEKYGRLYDWATAMALSPNCNTTLCLDQIQPKHKGICPSGWHIPSDEDWDTLIVTVEGNDYYSAGTKLRSKTGWIDDDDGFGYVAGTDNYGFSALPGGVYWSFSKRFGSIGYTGFWWSATESGYYDAGRRDMGNDESWVNSGSPYKEDLLSVRCLKD